MKKDPVFSQEQINKLHEEALELGKKTGDIVKEGGAASFQDATEKMTAESVTPEIAAKIEEYFPFTHKLNEQYVEAVRRINERSTAYKHVDFENLSENKGGLPQLERKLAGDLLIAVQGAAIYAGNLYRSKTGKYFDVRKNPEEIDRFCERIKNDFRTLSLFELASLEEYNPEHIETSTDFRSGDLPTAAFAILYGILHRDNEKGIDAARAFSGDELSHATRFIQRLFAALPLKRTGADFSTWPDELTARFNVSFGLNFKDMLDFYAYSEAHPEVLEDTESVKSAIEALAAEKLKQKNDERVQKRNALQAGGLERLLQRVQTHSFGESFIDFTKYFGNSEALSFFRNLLSERPLVDLGCGKICWRR